MLKMVLSTLVGHKVTARYMSGSIESGKLVRFNNVYKVSSYEFGSNQIHKIVVDRYKVAILLYKK